MDSQPNNNVDEPARKDHSLKEKIFIADLRRNGEKAKIDSFRNDNVEIYSNNSDDSHPHKYLTIDNLNKMKNPINNNDLKTMVSSLNSFVEKGYTEDYKALPSGLKALKSGIIYKPEEVKVIDFHRFEGSSDPADNSILYAIETSDGQKGTLVDAFGPESDTQVTKFMQQVEDISKKVNKENS